MTRKKKVFMFVVFGFLVLGSISVYLFTKPSKKSNQKIVTNIQATKTVLAVEATPTVPTTPTMTPPPAGGSTPIKPPKSLYVIAAFGDSMVDTMGEHLEYLDSAMNAKYQGVNFKFYNYGIGSQTVEAGLGRWDQDFVYQSRNYPAITKISADIIILGSFSYNPFFPHDAEKHDRLLNELLVKAKQTNATIYLLKEIAPLYDKFGQGPHGPNMTIDNAHDQSNRILEQLDKVEGIAKIQDVTLIDAFTLTQVSGKYGDITLVNSDDGIHPSIAGEKFIADQITKTVVLK